MTSGPRRVDPIDRAHLTGVTRPSPPIHRYAPAEHLTDLVQRYWIPVWSLTAPSTQSTLQHPVCLVVVSNTYERLYGVARGRSSVTLEGDGWAVGVMLTPAAGRLLWERSVADLTDRWVDLREVPGLDSARLVSEVRDAMAPAPQMPESHRAAITALESRLTSYVPVDEQGRLVNEIVAWLDERPEITRVDEVAERFDIGERSLQRLTEQRLGLSPKWLIQRRRLHDAVLALKSGPTTNLADMAARLGYADQAHFTHDFRTVTGMTPGDFLRDQAR